MRHLARVERVRILVAGPRAKSARRAAFSKKRRANLGAVEFFHRAHQSRLDARFRPDLRQESGRRARSPRDRTMALQRLGQIRRLAEGRRGHRAALVPKLKLPVWEPEYRGRRVVLEGGSIDVNGRGTLLTTEECLLSPVQARNPGFDRARSAKRFSATTWASPTSSGWATASPATTRTATSTIWRASSIPTTVVTVVEADRSDANYEPLQENLARLRKMKDQDGQPLRVETLPMPEPVYFDGQRLPASYANFYIANRTGAGADVQRSPTTASRSTRWPRLFPGPRSDRHRLPRPGPGPGHAALHDAAAAGINAVTAGATWRSRWQIASASGCSCPGPWLLFPRAARPNDPRPCA